MTKIKICGIKSYEDIKWINKYLPDYIGFVFADSSRKISLSKAIEISKKIDKRIKKVGVFVNEEIDLVNKYARECKLDIVQLHGNEDQKYIKKIEYPIWKATRIKKIDDITIRKRKYISGELIDYYSINQYGGSGEKIILDGIVKKEGKPFIILAGGLNSLNIKEAIKYVNPNVVDVSSGVETNMKKCTNKIEKFIEAVRLWLKNFLAIMVGNM